MNNCQIALNVAEKPSVAKKVTELLNKNQLNRIESLSKYNPVFQFDYEIRNTIYTMRFTSVRGHLMSYDFGEDKKRWILHEIRTLYDAEIIHKVNDESTDLRNNLVKHSRNVNLLILWLDCDREGESIAYEVIDLVRTINPKIQILRAHFSALTYTEITRAISTLTPPNKNLADAVEIRQRIDLIIGASFTRLQTLCFKNIFYADVGSNETGNKYVISYGPCQFPTLNFIVERSERIRKFVKEEFYYIELKVRKKEGNNVTDVIFNWDRNRLFDMVISATIFEKVLESKKGKIRNLTKKPISRFRPIPLNTVEMQKLISRKLKINSHVAMDIAEKLYQKGFISYPRTETTVFNPSINLKTFIEEQKKSSVWGSYAERLLDDDAGRRNAPRKGHLDDKAHPPIHPVKFPPDFNSLEPNEKKVYELLVRHFLACLSPDAKGQETTAYLEMGEEKFHSKGLIIDDIGYLEIYTYEKWNANYIPNMNVGEDIVPSEIFMRTGSTSPPNFLSESELITLMDKNGIGTDATIHEHIKHIQDRCYATFNGGFFKPTLIGTCLIKTYEYIGIEIFKPYLRSQMEKDMKSVCDGKSRKENVLADMKSNMFNIFNKVYGKIDSMKEYIKKFLIDNRNLEEEIFSMRIVNNNNFNPSRRGGNGGGGDGGGFPEGDNNDNDDNNNDNHDGAKKYKKKTNIKKKEENKNDYRGKNNFDKSNNKNKNNEYNNKTNKNFHNTTDNLIGICPKCKNGNMKIIHAKTGNIFMGCSGYPDCKNTKSFIENPKNINKTEIKCQKCPSVLFEIEFEDRTDAQCLAECYKNPSKYGSYKNNNDGNMNKGKGNENNSNNNINYYENDQGTFKSAKINANFFEKKSYNNQRPNNIVAENEIINLDIDNADYFV